jgi:predicted ArsR family transcriptional regulator|tara:strand:+ start:277 stop:516 length:240 start_codon:yes stop_codon:yes gene_type:complete
MNENHNKQKRGRKPVNVSWPENEFTASDVANNMKGKLSRVSVHSKLNSAVKDGMVTVVRKTEGNMGRPCFIYKKTQKCS